MLRNPIRPIPSPKYNTREVLASKKYGQSEIGTIKPSSTEVRLQQLSNIPNP